MEGKHLKFPGHALHVQGFKKQKGIGPLVSSQNEERPWSRSSTARQPPAVFLDSRKCLARKGLIETERHRSTCQQPGTKSGRRPANKPVINRSSTARRVSRFGLHGISYVHASGETSRTVVFGDLGVGNERSCPERTATPRIRPAPPCPAQPPCSAPPCPAPPRPARGMFGFWIRLVWLP